MQSEEVFRDEEGWPGRGRDSHGADKGARKRSSKGFVVVLAVSEPYRQEAIWRGPMSFALVSKMCGAS